MKPKDADSNPIKTLRLAGNTTAPLSLLINLQVVGIYLYSLQSSLNSTSSHHDYSYCRQCRNLL